MPEHSRSPPPSFGRTDSHPPAPTVNLRESPGDQSVKNRIRLGMEGLGGNLRLLSGIDGFHRAHVRHQLALRDGAGSIDEERQGIRGSAVKGRRLKRRDESGRSIQRRLPGGRGTVDIDHRLVVRTNPPEHGGHRAPNTGRLRPRRHVEEILVLRCRGSHRSDFVHDRGGIPQVAGLNRVSDAVCF